MGVNSLSPTQALNPGADLWVIGGPEESEWALKIDWELNLQVLRAGRHEKQSLQKPVTDLIARSGLANFPAPEAATAPLLIAADLNLPCRWVLSLTDWRPRDILKVWLDLGKPSLRIFFPKTRSVEAFAKEWSAMDGNGDFQAVLD